jgi:hypothetical protein
MSYVINTVAAAPMPGWATGSSTTTPVTAAASSAAMPDPVVTSAHAAASTESFSPPAVSQVASVDVHMTVPTMLPVTPTVSTDSGDAGPAAPKMMAVTSVFTGSDDGSATLDHASSTDLPFTHVAASDSDAAGPSDMQVADVGDDLSGWYLV